MKRSLGIAVGIALVLAVAFYGSSYLTSTKADLIPGQAPPVLTADPGTPTGTTSGDTMKPDPGTMANAKFVCECVCASFGKGGIGLCPFERTDGECLPDKEKFYDFDAAAGTDCKTFDKVACKGYDENNLFVGGETLLCGLVSKIVK